MWCFLAQGRLSPGLRIKGNQNKKKLPYPRRYTYLHSYLKQRFIKLKIFLNSVGGKYPQSQPWQFIVCPSQTRALVKARFWEFLQTLDRSSVREELQWPVWPDSGSGSLRGTISGEVCGWGEVGRDSEATIFRHGILHIAKTASAL